MESVRHVANPFCSEVAVAQSNYCLFDGKRLVRQEGGQPPSNMTSFVHNSFRALMLNEQFTCVGAKAAVRQGTYRFGFYDALGSAVSSAGLARDLFNFVQEASAFEGQFSAFVASFGGPLAPDETAFERLLWRTLQQLHDADAEHHQWDRKVAADTSDPKFSFSFGETAFFVVGLHAASSRATRRFAWPTLIFNPHEQFDRLKKDGRYKRFQQVIRAAEQGLQGNINPMLANFGDRSEASQYSGRQVGSDWRCPYRARVEQKEHE